MSLQSKEDLFRNQVETGLVSRDVDAFVALFSTECIVRDIAETEPVVGHEGLRNWIASYHSMMSETEVEYLTIATDDTRVVGEFVVRGRYHGDGSAAAGTPVELHYCVVDELENGLVSAETVYWAPNELDRQLMVGERPVEVA